MEMESTLFRKLSTLVQRLERPSVRTHDKLSMDSSTKIWREGFTIEGWLDNNEWKSLTVRLYLNLQWTLAIDIIIDGVPYVTNLRPGTEHTKGLKTLCDEIETIFDSLKNAERLAKLEKQNALLASL